MLPDSPQPDLLPLSHPALWPPICPSCNYPFTGLPAPRCPECGESIAPDEIVLVGELARERGGLSPNGSWLGGALLILVSLTIGVALILWKNGPNIAILAAVLAAATLLFTLHTVTWYIHRRHGFPPGVIRLSPTGYRFGAGQRVGVFHTWQPRTRLRIHYYLNGSLGFQASQMLGPFPLYSHFHLRLLITPEQLTQTILHLQHWQPDNFHLHQTTPALLRLKHLLRSRSANS